MRTASHFFNKSQEPTNENMIKSETINLVIPDFLREVPPKAEKKCNKKAILGQKKAVPKRKLQVSNYGECVICLKDQMPILIVDCGHSGICYDCGLKLIQAQLLCPFCNGKVTKIDKISFPLQSLSTNKTDSCQQNETIS